MSGIVIGIDAGTSGIRCVAMDGAGNIIAQAGVKMADHGEDGRDPATWLRAGLAALTALVRQIDPKSVRALAVDGTSGTVLPIDAAGTPLARALMYSDTVGDAAVMERINACAPAASAARGPTSGLAKALLFQSLPRVARIVHQADWLAGLLSGKFDVSDENNALKTGYNPVRRQWPEWIGRAEMNMSLLPRVVAAGTPIGPLSAAASERLGLPAQAIVVAGTTDGCASFLATGADAPGEGVTALGSSLTIKLLSDKPVNAPQFGIYSHRIGDKWLAGGASNVGGKVLAAHFSSEQIEELSQRIDPETDTGLDYYPLVAGRRALSHCRPRAETQNVAAPEGRRRFPQGDFRRHRQCRGAGLPAAGRIRLPAFNLRAQRRRRRGQSGLDPHPRQAARRADASGLEQ